MGLVINKPIGKTLKDLDPKLSDEDVLSHVPVYFGGPVSANEVILTAWKWLDDRKEFRLSFGLPVEKARELVANDPKTQLRAFLGYSGWEQGQLESELLEDTWIPTELDKLSDFDIEKHPSMWQFMLHQVKPELNWDKSVKDPSLN